MLLALPVIAFALFYRILRERGSDWRKTVLTAAVFWGTSVVVITESLSVPQRLTRGAVAICWLVVCIGLLLYGRTHRRHMKEQSGSGLPLATERMNSASKWLLVATGIIILLVAVVAIVAPPNVWDSMEYHLPRVTMWMSNHSVHFFPTPDYSQLIFGPWAEYTMMHAHLLWGGDRFVNFVEFFCMLGSVIGVSLIAKMLGAGLRGQALAAVACATLPEGVLEASGPMNTYVVSFWIMTTVAFLLIWNEDPNWLNTLVIGLSAGLALLTKGSAYVFLPTLVLACWWTGSTGSRIRFLKRSAVFLLVIVAINAPYFLRSYQLTGSPLGMPFPDGGPRLHWMMDHISPQAGFANMLRNVSLHTITPSPAANLQIERAFRLAIQGIGANPDDLRAIRLGASFKLNHFSLHELHAGNPLQFCLIFISVVLVFWKRVGSRERKPLWYALGLVLSFVFFSTLLKWDMWSGRHQLPLFLLGSALAGLALEQYFPRKIGTVAGIALIAYALPFAVANRTRSLVPWSRVDNVYQPRSVLYFSDGHEEIASANIAAAEAVNRLNCNNIAIDSYVSVPASQLPSSPQSFFVYPLFAMIHADGRARTVWYSGVHNWSNRYVDQEHHPAPCAVVCLECAGVPEKWAEYRSVGGRASVFDYIVVFSPQGSVLNPIPNSESDHSRADSSVQSEGVPD